MKVAMGEFLEVLIILSFSFSLPQLAALEDTLKMEQNQLLRKNFRAPQLLHGRQVLSSFSASQRSAEPSE